MTQNGDHPATLATAMKLRRSQLGLTAKDAAAQAGIARSTWRELEEGLRARMIASTGVRIDKVLGWPAGTSAGLIGGWIDEVADL